VDDAGEGDEARGRRRDGDELDVDVGHALQALQAFDRAAPLTPIGKQKLHLHATRGGSAQGGLQSVEVGAVARRGAIGEQLHVHRAVRGGNESNQARQIPKRRVREQALGTEDWGDAERVAILRQGDGEAGPRRLDGAGSPPPARCQSDS